MVHVTAVGPTRESLTKPVRAILLMRLVELAMASGRLVAERVFGVLRARLNEDQAVYARRQLQQISVESYSLALLALRNALGSEYIHVLHALIAARNSDGSWPAFSGDDPQGCWATAMAVLALGAVRDRPADLGLGIRWLLDERGREANWFWRWKFQTVDNSVKFDPAKYGWSWIPGTTSWVIPTAFSLIALQKAKDGGVGPESRFSERISVGVRMLLDRMCPGGGWNAGNSAAFGVAYTPYIDATAIALLSLRRHGHEPGVPASLSWLATQLPDCPSPYSLAWGLLAIAAYGRKNQTIDTAARATEALITALGNCAATLDMSTIATCALALEAIDGENVFEV